MRVLYGIQGTGNGHMTRARAMAGALSSAKVDVDYLVSGRPRDQLFDMEPFGDFRCVEGLTFSFHEGKIDIWRTIKNASVRQLWRDIKSVDLSNYDLVITDFEPVTAWAARLQKVPSLALSHQACFRYDVPKQGYDLGSRLLMKGFAPASEHVGLHWHHFNQSILPPVIDTSHQSQPPIDGKIVVYLPFEELPKIQAFLETQPEAEFYCYHPELSDALDQKNIHWRPLSRDGFATDLLNAQGVICNSGFELPSESLFLGKKLLVKPLQGQFEQESNALTLSQLSLATVMDHLDSNALERFLLLPAAAPIPYPDVADAIAGWIADGRETSLKTLAGQLWQQVGS
ncbi:MJ1255/VC2487 family glycosyltransferase [Corallincola platygyrae]|uniref:MJ1255/VC2487 family glycosyltransferase n=1 Tax=Corallincola platygyrae TaxID=1193278 RepID=A0ABW4XR23_9GAMM